MDLAASVIDAPPRGRASLSDGYLHLRHFIRRGWIGAVRRGALALTAATLVAGLAAGVLAANAPGWYEAEAQLYLQPAALTGGDLQVARDVVPS